MLAWPDDSNVIIKSLALGNELYPQKIKQVELLGYGRISFTRTQEGMIVTLPSKHSDKIAPVLKIKK